MEQSTHVIPAKALPTTQGVTRAKAMPSGDPKVDRLFRLMPTGAVGRGSDGVTIPGPGSGVLVRFSVAGAFTTIKAHAERTTAEARGEDGALLARCCSSPGRLPPEPGVAPEGRGVRHEVMLDLAPSRPI